MEERRAVEKKADPNPDDDDNLSQDSENYNMQQLERDTVEQNKKSHEEPFLKIKWKNVKNSQRTQIDEE